MRTIDPTPEELKRFCALPGLGELDPEAVRRHAPDAMLLDEEAGAPAGRASLWWRAVPPYKGERVGLVGHYAATDAAGASRVLEAACERLAQEGCTFAIGPMDGSTWRRYRLLTHRGTEPPFFLEPDNPDDWPRHFEAARFQPLAQYFSALCEDIRAPIPLQDGGRRLREAGITCRPIDLARLDDELRALWTLATDSFSGNFLYTPIGEPEYRAMYAALRPVLRPEMVLVAEDARGPAGFTFAVPDILQARRGQPVDTAVFKTIGIASRLKGQGVGRCLFDETIRAARALGFRRMVFALFHADNPSGRLAHAYGRDIRRYSLYGRRL